MIFCASIFNSKGYDITGVSVTYKRNIGRWVTVESRMEETRDSRGVRGNPIIHDRTCLHTHFRDHTPVDRHGEPTPKTINFMRTCDGHTRGVFLMPRPGIRAYPRIKGNLY